MEPSQERPKILALIGAPGSGKGTLSARILSAYPDARIICPGDMFRSHMQNNTELGQQIKQYMDRGSLVPDHITLAMLNEQLDTPEMNGKLIVIDGFPRSYEQGIALYNALCGDLRAIYLKIEKHELEPRILGRANCPVCGRIYNSVFEKYRPRVPMLCDTCPDQGLVQRSDDTKEILEKRWNTFVKQTNPIITYYKSVGVLREFDALAIDNMPVESILELGAG